MTRHRSKRRVIRHGAGRSRTWLDGVIPMQVASRVHAGAAGVH